MLLAVAVAQARESLDPAVITPGDEDWANKDTGRKNKREQVRVFLVPRSTLRNANIEENPTAAATTTNQSPAHRRRGDELSCTSLPVVLLGAKRISNNAIKRTWRSGATDRAVRATRAGVSRGPVMSRTPRCDRWVQLFSGAGRNA